MLQQIEDLAREMIKNKIDAYIITSDDDHASEYVNDHFMVREYVSGFTGSAGTLLISVDHDYGTNDPQKMSADSVVTAKSARKNEEKRTTDHMKPSYDPAIHAWLWTDGRYFLQAADELKGTGIELMKTGEPGVPTITQNLSLMVDEKWRMAKGNPAPGGHIPRPNTDDTSVVSPENTGRKDDRKVYRLGFCGNTMPAKVGIELEKIEGLDVVWSIDLAGGIWPDRPALIPTEIKEFPLSSAGMTASRKIRELRNIIVERKVSTLILSDLTEIAWLFNLRGKDIPHTPVFYSYAMLSKDEVALYVCDPGFSESDTAEKLKSEIIGLKIKDYDEFLTDVGWQGGKSLWIDLTKISYAVYASLPKGVALIDSPTPAQHMKAVKNDVEIASTVHAHLTDAACVTKFIFWLKNTIGKKNLTESDCAEWLDHLRLSQTDCFDLSFPTIAGYNKNGAIIHYEPVPEKSAELSKEGFLLVDSGGQYTTGTTDITRTIALGQLTDEMRKYYTLVLKSHIRLATAVFPRGTTGKTLDEIARAPLNEHDLDYAHGTGHGVGHVLSVHEGPNYISKRNSDAEIVPGMITSNEPGIYVEGKFGIRLESEILCVPVPEDDRHYSGIGLEEWPATTPPEIRATSKRKYGDMLCFRTITTVPFERDAIIPEMLTKKELLWLNDQNQHIRNSLMLLLNSDEAEWLMDVTMPYPV